MSDFSEIIKKCRKKSGLSQFDFGSEIGVSWVTIWRWEHDQHLPKDNVKQHWIDKAKSV